MTSSGISLELNRELPETLSLPSRSAFPKPWASSPDKLALLACLVMHRVGCEIERSNTPKLK
jgi:hypothetical protein